MSLQMIQPREQYLLREVIDRRAVLEHIRLVLIGFAKKPGFSKFYVGITRDLDTRLSEHQRKRPDFKLMVPVYQEQASLLESSFDSLERDTIAAFRQGIVHPDTKRVMMTCANVPGGATPKSVLYLLVG